MVQSTNGKGGKGGDRRPCQVSREVYDLNWEYSQGGMSLDEYYRRKKCIQDNNKRQ